MDQHHVGRITDVKTDGAGRPFLEQRPEHQHLRPQGADAGSVGSEGPAEAWPDTPPAFWGAKPWPPRTVVQTLLARGLIKEQTKARAQPAGTGSGKRKPRAGAGHGQVKASVPGKGSEGSGGQDLMGRLGHRKHGWL